MTTTTMMMMMIMMTMTMTMMMMMMMMIMVMMMMMIVMMSQYALPQPSITTATRSSTGCIVRFLLFCLPSCKYLGQTQAASVKSNTNSVFQGQTFIGEEEWTMEEGLFHVLQSENLILPFERQQRLVKLKVKTKGKQDADDFYFSYLSECVGLWIKKIRK